MTSAVINRKANGHFAKGNSANPKGRPRGHQERFRAKFWADLHEAWTLKGHDALMRMIETHPNQFIDVCARVLPKDEQRKEIAHQIEITLKEPEWVKLAELVTIEHEGD